MARPVGTFKLSLDYHFQTLRANLDLLNLIQLSLCVTKIKNNEVLASVIWQFNFHYDVTLEMYNEEHLLMLQQSLQINFQMHMAQGVAHFAFAELIIDLGLLLDESISWISYHLGYDLGFLVSLLINDNLPVDEKDFYWWCTKYFPNFYDLKHVGDQLLSANGKLANGTGLAPQSAPDLASDVKNLASNNKPSIEYLAEELHLLPMSPVIRQYFASQGLGGQFPGHQHQQMTSTLHAYLSMECFKELLRQTGYDSQGMRKFRGVLWGLGNVYADTQANGGPAPAGKTGVVHFGRAL